MIRVVLKFKVFEHELGDKLSLMMTDEQQIMARNSWDVVPMALVGLWLLVALALCVLFVSVHRRFVMVPTYLKMITCFY